MIPALERRLPAFIARERVDMLRSLLRLPADVPDGSGAGPIGLVGRLLGACERSDHWIVAAVMTASMPLSLFVDEVTRAVDLGDVPRAAKMLLTVTDPTDDGQIDWDNVGKPYEDIPYAEVRIIADTVLVDVFGIDDDRAPVDARLTSRALLDAAPDGVTRVTWSDEYRALVEVGAPEGEVVVPYGGSYVLLGICDEPPRAARLMSLAQTSSTSVVGIGYGLGPLNDVELYDDVEKPRVEPRRYSWHLATNRVMDEVITVSDTAQQEMVGWKRMLPALGVNGPELIPAHLGTDALAVAPAGPAPRLLVAGSNSAVGGFLTVANALGLLPPDLVPAEILRLEPADGKSIDFEVEGVSTRPVVDLATLRAGDVVISCGSSSSHDVVLESLLAAGIRGVVADSGFGRELDRYGTCHLVPRRDALATAAALEGLLRASEPQGGHASDDPSRPWGDFTALVWSRAVAAATAAAAPTA